MMSAGGEVSFGLSHMQFNEVQYTSAKEHTISFIYYFINKQLYTIYVRST